MRPPVCCVAYSDVFSKESKQVEFVTFCGKIKKSEDLSLYPNNASCIECRNKIHKLVGRDYSQLNDISIMEKIINIKPTKVLPEIEK
jgi:hypothetical protein